MTHLHLVRRLMSGALPLPTLRAAMAYQKIASVTPILPFPTILEYNPLWSLSFAYYNTFCPPFNIYFMLFHAGLSCS